MKKTKDKCDVKDLNETPNGDFVERLTQSKSLAKRKGKECDVTVKQMVSIMLVFGQVQQQQST